MFPYDIVKACARTVVQASDNYVLILEFQLAVWTGPQVITSVRKLLL